MSMRETLGLFSTSSFDDEQEPIAEDDEAMEPDEGDREDISEVLTPEKKSEFIIDVVTPKRIGSSPVSVDDNEGYITPTGTPKSRYSISNKRYRPSESFRTPPKDRNHRSSLRRDSDEETAEEQGVLATPPTLSQREFVIEDARTPERPKPRPVNNKTLKKQLEKRTTSIDLDVVVCNVWEMSDTFWKALVRDGDKSWFMIEFSGNERDKRHIPAIGEFLRFTDLIILEKILPTMSSTLFSVMEACGYQRQHAYYRILGTQESEWSVITPEDIIDLEYDPAEETRLISELEQLEFSSSNVYLVRICEENESRFSFPSQISDL